MDDLFGDDNNNDEEQSSQSIVPLRRPRACGILAFHNGTEAAMLMTVHNRAEKGNVRDILRVIDEFCYTRHWMMHLGDKKRGYLESALLLAQKSSSQESCVEIGSYCGYSALCIASMLTVNGKLFCVERDIQAVGWTTLLIEYANLLDKVTVLHGTVDSNIGFLMKIGSHVDLLFIDHDKNSYLSDLQHIENAGLFRHGSIVVADNVLSFGRPLDAYLAYVKDPLGPYTASTTYETTIEYVVEDGCDGAADVVDGVEVSVHK